MVYTSELINDNGISAIALAFFTALFTMVGTVTVAVLNQRGKLRETSESSKKAVTVAERVERNTAPVSNGFAARMDRKLDILAANQDRLENAFQEHLEWHLNKETPK